MTLLSMAVGLALAVERPDAPTAAVLTGGSAPGQWDASVSAGFPWFTARGQVGLKGGWTPIVEVQSALWTRWQPSAGVGLRWVDQRWRVSGEVLGGWLVQTGTLARRGPSGELRLKAGRAAGLWQPYLHAGSKHTLLMTRIRTDTADGDEVRWRAGHEWTLTGGVGTGIAVGRTWGLDVGMDLPWVGVPTLSIPGLHLGVVFGGGR